MLSIPDHCHLGLEWGSSLKWNVLYAGANHFCSPVMQAPLSLPSLSLMLTVAPTRSCTSPCQADTQNISTLTPCVVPSQLLGPSTGPLR